MKRAYILIGMSLLMILVGIFGGEVSVVFNKAINLCLECVGIG